MDFLDRPLWKDRGAGAWVLRLYTAGNSPRSRRAIRNLLRIRDRHLPRETEIEFVDLHHQTHRAAEARIVGAPTLVKELPPPRATVVGDLSDEARVIAALGVAR